MSAMTESKMESLRGLEESLAAMRSRLAAIVAEPALTEDTFVEVTAIYNNVSYAFLYLEANEEYEQYEQVAPWRDAFYADPDLDARILELLQNLRCGSREAEESRLAYVRQLTGRGPGQEPTAELEAALEKAKAVLEAAEGDQRGLLGRLSPQAAAGDPGMGFYQLVSRTRSAGTRAKLARAWAAARDGRLDDLVEPLDRMVRLREQAARAAGFGSTLDRTLDKCAVGEPEVTAFLDRYLRMAIERHQAVQAEVRELVPTEGDPMDDFPFYMQALPRKHPSPLFPLDGCLTYISGVAERVFGLEIERQPAEFEHVLPVVVSAGGREVGRINFDLWDTAAKAATANYTRALRNRAEWSGLVQLPVAFVSCRFRHDRGGRRITFQNVHSLFHEFGHALNHLLIRHRIPNRSGMDYLPLERLEYLSMWAEKWVYRPEFGAAVGLDEDEQEGARTAQRMKALEYRRTYVQRALTAALDVEVHRAGADGFRATWQALDDRYGVGRFAALGDVAAYFTWPMYQNNPGANFIYLWGSSDSSQKFTAFDRAALTDLPDGVDVARTFAPSFDIDVPGPVPDSTASFDFYDRVAAGPPAAGAPS